MTDKTADKSRVPPADAVSPLFTWSQTMRGEMQRVLDETAQAQERLFGELERGAKESERIAAAQMQLMRDASRAAVSMWRQALSA